MQIELWINEKKVKGEIEPDEILLDFLRKQGMTSVKRGCETSNCGLRASESRRNLYSRGTEPAGRFCPGRGDIL